MNIALILAGGIGERTGQDIPKQFLNVFDKPVIIYTLEAFQKHPDIDGILVTCLEGWHEILWSYAKQYKIDKLKWIVDGGTNGQSSARNGLIALKKYCKKEDIVIIHDAIRPMITSEIISDCIVKCRLYGSGLSAIPCQETILRTDNGKNGKQAIERHEIMRVQTPQAYRFGKALKVHEEAFKQGIENAVYTNMLMITFGEELFFSLGSEKNIKITNLEDLDIFKAIYKMNKENWIKE